MQWLTRYFRPPAQSAQASGQVVFEVKRGDVVGRIRRGAGRTDAQPLGVDFYLELHRRVCDYRNWSDTGAETTLFRHIDVPNVVFVLRELYDWYGAHVRRSDVADLRDHFEDISSVPMS